PFPTPPFVDEEVIWEVVENAKEGNDASFATLYQRYHKQIYSHLFRMLGDREDANDLTVESFTRAWRALPSLADGRCFQSWLYRIATNAALDHLRRKRKYQLLWVGINERPIGDLIENFDKDLEVKELLHKAFMSISKKPRACLYLYLEGFSKEEIADQLGLAKDSFSTY